MDTMTSIAIIVYTSIIAFVLYCILKLCTFVNRNSTPKLPPGPKPWPIVGNLPHLGSTPHSNLAAMARIYGPLMYLRLGFVHIIVVASAKVAEQLFKANDVNFSSRPKVSGGKHIAYNYQDLVFAPYGPRWRMLRKVCSVHLFSAKALDDYGHVREDEAALLVRDIAGCAGKTPVKLGNLFYEFTTNTLTRVMLGWRTITNTSNGTGDLDPKAEDFKNMVVELMELAGVFNIGDYIPALDWLDLQGVARKMKKLHARFDKFLNDVLKEHKRNMGNDNNGDHGGAKQRDLLSTLISLQDNVDGEGGKLTDTEIKALLLNLFSAGTDTSSSTMEWVVAEVLRHPEVMAEAQKELDSVVGPNRLVMESDINQLPYLQAIVKESLRLHPSTPLSLPRMAAESCVINDYFIPGGATVLINVWAIGRDPDSWADPLEFRPQRFLPGGERPNADVKGNNFEVIPFGAGRRICAGMSLGLRVLQLLTATLVHAFDWELAGNKRREDMNMEEIFGLALRRAEPLLLHPKPRLAPHVYRA